tara:strand:+ start:37 stop:225 length:189 start_codon:yes stop_codon:yes gene_type:complete
MSSPKQDGWKYFAINLTDTDHQELTDMMDELCLMTGVSKKRIIQILVRDKLNQLKKERIKYE